MEKLTLFELISTLRDYPQFRFINKQRIIDFGVQQHNCLLKAYEVGNVCQLLIHDYNAVDSEEILLDEALTSYLAAKKRIVHCAAKNSERKLNRYEISEVCRIAVQEHQSVNPGNQLLHEAIKAVLKATDAWKQRSQKANFKKVV